MKTYSLDEAQDLLIGKIGTARRDQFEFELKLVLCEAYFSRPKF